MSHVRHDSVGIHYEVFGQGEPIVLLHGFASNLQANWVSTGWIESLTPLRQVVALDCRGHGESDRPREPSAYAGDATVGDVIAVLDELGIKQAELFGYSMGGGIALRLLAAHPERFTAAIVGGVGERNDERLQALDGLRGVPDRCAVDLGAVTAPVLIVNGALDYAVGSPESIASRMPSATVIAIPGCDHISVVSDEHFKDAVIEFLSSAR
jgi:pimeloyl-ACP methyl ester carboxylesterase